jgi:hypothetical protein
MKTRQEAAIKVVLQDPDVLSLGSSIGGNSSSGFNYGTNIHPIKASWATTRHG